MGMLMDLSAGKFIRGEAKRFASRDLTAIPVRELWGPAPSARCRQSFQAEVFPFPAMYLGF